MPSTVPSSIKTAVRDEAESASSPTTGNVVDPETLEILRKPIANAKEAHAAAKRDFIARNTAHTNLALVQNQHNGEPPYKGALGKRGQGWRADFSTRSMEMMVTRKTPVLVGFVDGLRFLTASRLPDNTPEAHDKSEKFQAGFTRLVRSWGGWRNFLYPLVTENVLHGGAAAAPLDEIEWRPQFFRQTEFAVPQGTTQNTKELKRISFYKAFAIDELRQLVKDRESAEDAGWNVDNVAEQLNKATAKPNRQSGSGTQAREGADRQREGDATYSGSADDGKVVEAYVQLYREYNGKVSQYIVAYSGGQELFFKEDMYPSMEEACALFAVQFGNGRFYGSVGLGRVLFGPHLARNRNFCRMLDDIWYSSLEDARTDETTKTKVAVTINYPFRVTTGAGEVPTAKRPSYTADFLLVDEKLESLIEQMANTYLPNKIEGGGEKPTARQVIEDVKKANQSDGDLLARFYGQFCALMNMMQRRAYSVENLEAAMDVFAKLKEGKIVVPKDQYERIKSLATKQKSLLTRIKEWVGLQKPTVDADQYVADEIPDHLDREAVWSAVDMMQGGLTALDILRIAETPASEPLGDNSAMLGQKIQAIDAEYRGDPNVDQAKLRKYRISSLGTPQLADDLILPDEIDQTVIAEAQSQQLGEIADTMILGKVMPVSPRHNHPVHMAVLFEEFDAVTQGLPAAPSEQYLQGLENNLAHAELHMQEREKAKEQGEQLGKDRQRLRVIAGQIARLREIWNAEQSGVTASATNPASPADIAAANMASRQAGAALDRAATEKAATAFRDSAGLAKRDAEVSELLRPPPASSSFAPTSGAELAATSSAPPTNQP